MIGNDIIDLEIAYQHFRCKEERYWKKVLTENEISWITNHKDRILAFHTLWAIKEATYKLVCKLGLAQSFIPKKISIKNPCSLNYYETSVHIVKTPVGDFPFCIKKTQHTLEAFAARDTHLLAQAIFYSFPILGNSYATQSYSVKEHLKKSLSEFLLLDIEKLSIRKENSIPKLYISQKLAPVDISISHHGSWGAYGFALLRTHYVKSL